MSQYGMCSVCCAEPPAVCRELVRVLACADYVPTSSTKKKLSKIRRLACLGITGAMRTTPTMAVEALICLPPLYLVVQNEARSAAHRLWSLGGWSYLHPNRGHCSILMRLRQSDPLFNIGVDVMRPAFNLEPKYRVTMLTREEWTARTGDPPAIKGLIWFTDRSRMREGIRTRVCGKEAQFFPGKMCYGFPGQNICYLGLCL